MRCIQQKRVKSSEAGLALFSGVPVAPLLPKITRHKWAVVSAFGLFVLACVFVLVLRVQDTGEHRFKSNILFFMSRVVWVWRVLAFFFFSVL